MLCIEPHKCPTAEVMAARFRLIALYYTTESIDEVYDELYKCVEESQAMVEVYLKRARYNSWKEACGVIKVEDLDRLKQGFDVSLQILLEVLVQT